MLNVNCLNWEYDLYMRIDSEIYISHTLKNKYITEIIWCYRFGFIDEQHRDNLIDYLEYMFDKTELDNLKQKEILRLQREYEISLEKSKKQEQEEIKALFLTMGKTRRSKNNTVTSYN